MSTALDPPLSMIDLKKPLKDLKRFADIHAEKVKAVCYVHDLVTGRVSQDGEKEDRLKALEICMQWLEKDVTDLTAKMDWTPFLARKHQ